MSFDVIFDTAFGIQSTFMYVTTDVGHIVDDADGERTKKAAIGQLEPMEVQRYTIDFHC
jgi:hypothetical protein